MAFTMQDRRDLEDARQAVARLEAKETEALDELTRVLRTVPSFARSANWDAAEVAQFADSIRDALEPFDSGKRLAQDQSK